MKYYEVITLIVVMMLIVIHQISNVSMAALAEMFLIGLSTSLISRIIFDKEVKQRIDDYEKLKPFEFNNLFTI